MKRATLVFSICLLTSAGLSAQTAQKADVTLCFDISQEGVRYQPTWGLDQAWISEQNMRKGINHMGKENVGIGRSCFRTTKALTNDSALANDQITYLRRRANIFNLVNDSLPLVLTSDQEAGSDPYFVTNKNCNINHWAANINSHVHWMQQNTKHPVIGVSPYNEPDYWTVEEGATVTKQWQLAKMLKEQYPRMNEVNMVGGNTLNDDKALEWYTSGKKYYDWGNTHQLAGSFANFANFFQQLQKDGKVGYADEMHNVGEAMIGLKYGMTVGIWWGFDSRARGEFCDISRHGTELAYGEHRNNWTAASVWQHDDGRTKAFIGSSERQAATTSYQFVSLDRDVYYDGQGPQRQFRMVIPGGAVGSYQNGQTNAERVIDITWGEDVAPTAITDGVYKLVNKATGNVAAVSGDNIVMQKYTGAKVQQWNVALSDPRIGGDYSFYDFTSVNNPKTRLNLRDFSTADNANIMAYSQNAKPTSNEQWYLQYAGNGYYYIRNRESALYMAAASSGTNNGVNVVQRTMQTKEDIHQRLLWRLLPAAVAYETEAPAKPTGLLAVSQSGSTLLSWDAGTEEDIEGYMVLRADEGQDNWNTIARYATSPYTDNTCKCGTNYLYKIKAIDRSQNMSEASDEVLITTQTDKALVAHWTMEQTLDDLTENQLHAIPAVEKTLFINDGMQGENSLRFSSNQWLQLPTNVVQGNSISISMWYKCLKTSAWQRIFDFGYDKDHYIYLTPSTGAKMRMAFKNGGDEQTLDCTSQVTTRWKHLVVTICPDSTDIYINGERMAHSQDITIKPLDVKPVLNYLGRSQTGSHALFEGNMDDIRIYNYALSADEVKEQYQESTGVHQPVVTTQEKQTTIHTLDGIRREQPMPGLNIINGKVILSTPSRQGSH